MKQLVREVRAVRMALLAVGTALLAVGLAGCPRWFAVIDRSPELVLRDVRVIDVERGAVSEPQTVVIRGDRVLQLGAVAAAPIPEGARVVEGGGRFLMPGLVDMHVHLFDRRGAVKEWMGPLFLAHGVTSVREMAARAEWITALRASQVGASVRIAGVGVPVGAPGAEVDEQIAKAKAAGATFLKVFSEVPAARWRQILDESKRHQLPVIGHVPAQVSLLEALGAGQRGDEHLMQVFEACTPLEAELLEARRAAAVAALPALLEAQEPAVLASYDGATCARAAQRAADHQQVQTPTLVLPFAEQSFGARRFEEDPRWTSLGAAEQERWKRIARELTPPQRAGMARRWGVAKRIAGALIGAGALIVAGTDAPQPYVYPGSSLHEELALLVEAGMTPAQALRAATLTAAQVLGLAAQQGTVAVGKRADLVLLDGNPLVDISNTRRIHAVIFAGRWHARAALDELLRR